MKPVHSRETLCTIDYFPFEDEVLKILVNPNERSGRIYLTYQCICRYLNLFSETYHFPTACDVEKILLTQKKILDSECICYYVEDSEYNAADLLNNLALYCNWDYVSISEAELQEAGLDLELEAPLDVQIDKVESFSERTKRLLKRFPFNVEAALIDELSSLYVLQIRGIPEYRRYKEQHPDRIRDEFLREDRIISSILENADDVMIWDRVTECRDDTPGEYLLSWTTGSDGYNYVSIGNLSPNWLISMYVLHGLLDHAQRLFGYSIGGNEKYD